ncbi:hypothetical protein UPYG_G00353410 [Umbra pygmaea]|uniref:Secreted protein n=1 Tax=Umbra pygmaea TaxID=75934 RepID=A0ABD0VX22_UMBPY
MNRQFSFSAFLLMPGLSNDQVFHRQAGQEEAEGHCWAYHFQISTTLVSKERKETHHTDQVVVCLSI